MAAFWRTDPNRAAWTLLLASLPLFAGLILWLDRGTTYNVDQIRFWMDNPGVGFKELFYPQNGNLLVPTILSYKVFLGVFGSSFLPFRLLHVITLLGTCTVFFALVKRLTGPLPALVVTMVLLVFGSDWGHVGTALGFTVLSSIGTGLAALLLAERRDLLGDIGACVLLTVSVASFSTGLAFVVGLAVGLSLAPDRRRRLWVVAVPLALYIVWGLWARENAPTVGGPELSNILLFPSYSYVSLAAVFASLSGLNFDFSVDPVRFVSLGPGPLLALLALAGLVLRVSKGSLPRFFWIGAAMLSAYWILGTLVVDPASGIRVPTKTRYMFPGTVLVILVGAALLTQWKPARQSIVALVAVAACAFATNLALLLDGTAYFRNDFSASAKAQFAMLDLAAERTAPDFDPRYQSPDFSVISTPAGPYLRAAALYGSPGFTLEELHEQPSPIRVGADNVLSAALGLALESTDLPAKAVCKGATTYSESASALIPAEGGAILIYSDEPASVLIGRFGDDPTVSLEICRGPRPPGLRSPRTTPTSRGPYR